MKVVSLCTGCGGLELALAAAGIEHELAYVADPDPAASAVLAARFPGVRNLGDITAVDWAEIPLGGGPLMVTAGFPCQDISCAGLGAGIATGTRSGVWLHVARAIADLGPDLVLIENVRGLLSARAHSDVEPCPWCLGDRGGPGQEPVLRALGAVLGDLSSLRYDAEWITVAASGIGAAHQRERVFLLAYPADTASHPWRLIQRDGSLAAHAVGVGHGNGGAPGWPRVQTAAVPGSDHDLVPTPGARLGRCTSITPATAARRLTDRKQNLDDWAALLPTPRASANENRQTKRTPSQEAGKHGRNLAAEVCSLLPTPRATDGTNGGPNQRGSSGDLMLPAAVQPGRWGQYAAAIARWEHILGRPAPEPTEPSKSDAVRLSPRFVEWLMGLPEGWVCDVPGLSRNDQLRLLGNGVVYQQAAYALHLLAGAR